MGSLGDIACFSFYPGRTWCLRDAGAGVTNNAEVREDPLCAPRPQREVHSRHRGLQLSHRHNPGGVLHANCPTWKIDQVRRGTSLTIASCWPCHLVCRTSRSMRNRSTIVRGPRQGARPRSRRSERARDRAGVHYPVPLHLQPAYAHLGHRAGDFPHAEAAAQEVLSLPLYAEMTDEQVRAVCETLTEVLG